MSGPKSVESWHCPNCLRTVPGRVGTCYCGVERSQVSDGPDPAAASSRGYGGLASIVAAALGGGLLVAWFQQGEPPAPAPSQAPVTVSSAPTPRPPPNTLRPAFSAASPEPTPVPPVLRAPIRKIEPAPDPEVASSEPEQEEEVDSVASMREDGTRQLDAALAALAPKLQMLEGKVRTYGEGCATSREALPRGGCPTIKQDILRLRTEIERAVSENEEAARRSWVTPGTRRELLQAHGLDPTSWSEIVAASDRALTGR